MLATASWASCPPLLFADDMLLLSNTPAGLQVQLEYLQSSCCIERLPPMQKKRKKNGHALHSCQEGCRQPGAAAWLPTSTGVTAALVTWLQGGGFGASEAHCAHGRTRSVKERCRKMEAEWM